MFNKKYKKRIEELEEIIIKKEVVIKTQKIEIQSLNAMVANLERNNISFSHKLEEKDKKIEHLNTKIMDLEACFKPLETNCEEVVEKPKKTPKKTSKTTKKA